MVNYMGLLTKELWVTVTANTKEYYESLGYQIPKVKKRNKYVVEKGTQILVNVHDLKKGSNEIVEVQCEYCGRIYKVQYAQYINMIEKFNVSYCYKCIRHNFYSGINSKNYNQSMSEEERMFKRTTSEYRQFLYEVNTRDKHTCQRCGSKENIEVHHLNGYNWYIKGRTDVTNGVCLCKDCHKNFHSLYGYKDCTIEQYMEWMNITKLDLDNMMFKSTTRQIYSYEEDMVYSSANEFMIAHNLKDNSNIYKLCNHKQNKNSKVLTVAGCHLVWLDEYLQNKCQITDFCKEEIKYDE